MTAGVGAVSDGHGCATDWQRAENYAGLRLADRSAFAWEWLRRSPAYRQAWYQRDNPSSRDPGHFGLVRFEDPERAIPRARPIWSASVDPMVIRASVVDPFASISDRLDLRLLAPLVTLAIDEGDIEHLLLSDGARLLRIDIVEGTLIGCPASLRYSLEGIAQLRGPIAALARLTTLIEQGEFAGRDSAAMTRRDRWIVELRVADAVLAGANHQQIARILFGSAISDQRWRAHNSSYRQRVQRLVRRCRANLLQPLQQRWFAMKPR